MKTETRWELEDDAEFILEQALPELELEPMPEKQKRITSKKWLGWVLILIPVIAVSGFLILIGQGETVLLAFAAVFVVFIVILFGSMIGIGLSMLRGDD